MVTPALLAAEQLDATVINMRFIKPLDEETVLKAAREHELLITLEENAVMGGAGSAINECLIAHDVHTPTINLGLPDSFTEHGSRDQLLAECGLDVGSIVRTINDQLQAQTPLDNAESCQITPIRVKSH